MLSLRFDIDTRRGLTKGVPPLLDLLDKHGLKASFFCVMGPEANLAEVIRFRLMAASSSKSKLNVAARGGLVSLLRSAAFPGSVGIAHPQLLRVIVERGHELQPHGWSHIQWQRNIDNIDVKKHLRLAMAGLEDIMGYRPTGYAAPGRTWNQATLAAFDEAELVYSGDMDGSAPFRPAGHSHLQLPITRFETISQMRAAGLSGDAIVGEYVSDLETNRQYCCLFEHPDDLTSNELAIFDRLFQHVSRGRFETATLGQIAGAI